VVVTCQSQQAFSTDHADSALSVAQSKIVSAWATNALASLELATNGGFEAGR
jgi:hypothetical protein